MKPTNYKIYKSDAHFIGVTDNLAYVRMNAELEELIYKLHDDGAMFYEKHLRNHVKPLIEDSKYLFTYNNKEDPGEFIQNNIEYFV